MRFARHVAVGLAVAAMSSTASDVCADERVGARLSLEMSGVRYGVVKAIEGAEKAGGRELVVIAGDISAPFASLVGTFVQSKVVKKDLRLTSGAVMRKANDARLTTVKLPPMGGGGAADLELVFVVPQITTQPLLSAKESPPPTSAQRIASFRIAVSGMAASEAPKLDGITLSQGADGHVTTGDIAFEIGAGGAPPFVAWQKANGGRPAPRSLHLEYAGPDGSAVLKLLLDRCTPTSVKPMGTNGTTRIALSCAELRPG